MTTFDFGIAWDGSTVAPNAPARGRVGRNYSNGDLRGVYLLNERNGGKDLLLRLKSSAGALADEIVFWAGVCARATTDTTLFDCVSYPPSSEVRSFYMAGHMAGIVARLLDLPCHAHFANNSPRGTRANMAAKLHEVKDYAFRNPTGCKHILMFDDAVTTRKTAEACISAASPVTLFWLFLYASKSD